MAPCTSEVSKALDDPGLNAFLQLWNKALSPTVYCAIYLHPLDRICPVVLNYEDLTEAFRSVAAAGKHEGKTDRVHLTPERCYKCSAMICNGGVCDPI